MVVYSIWLLGIWNYNLDFHNCGFFFQIIHLVIQEYQVLQDDPVSPICDADYTPHMHGNRKGEFHFKALSYYFSHTIQFGG